MYIFRKGRIFFFFCAPLPFLSFFFFRVFKFKRKGKRKKEMESACRAKRGIVSELAHAGWTEEKGNVGIELKKKSNERFRSCWFIFVWFGRMLLRTRFNSRFSCDYSLNCVGWTHSSWLVFSFLSVCMFTFIVSLSLSLSCVCLPICIFDLIIIISFFLFVVFLVFRRRAIFTTSARWDWKSPASCPSTARQRWRTVARYWHRSPFPLRNSTRSPFSAHLMDTWKRYSVWHWCSGKQKFVSIARSGVQCKCNKLRTAHTHTQWGDVIRLRVSFLCG